MDDHSAGITVVVCEQSISDKLSFPGRSESCEKKKQLTGRLLAICVRWINIIGGVSPIRDANVELSPQVPKPVYIMKRLCRGLYTEQTVVARY